MVFHLIYEVNNAVYDLMKSFFMATGKFSAKKTTDKFMFYGIFASLTTRESLYRETGLQLCMSSFNTHHTMATVSLSDPPTRLYIVDTL